MTRRSHTTAFRWVRILPLVTVSVALTMVVANANQTGSNPSQDDVVEFNTDAIRKAFEAAHQGYSSDELLVRDDLCHGFFQALSIPADAAHQKQAALKTLLRLRKSGQLRVSTVKRASPWNPDVAPIAEIAVRSVLDRHPVSTDDIMTNPILRKRLQSEAEALVPDVDATDVRKAVLSLRKRRQLRPELVLRVADWGRTIETHAWNDLDLAQVPSSPGIYVFRDSRGYLYVGEASQLRKRLTQHQQRSHNLSLDRLLKRENRESVLSIELHIFASDSPAKSTLARRAYESELIRSREPLFNLQP
ncbi:MAG: GIY-YIG nuclease family protein [Planctomycetota bacterium]